MVSGKGTEALMLNDDQPKIRSGDNSCIPKVAVTSVGGCTITCLFLTGRCDSSIRIASRLALGACVSCIIPTRNSMHCLRLSDRGEHNAKNHRLM